MKTILEFPKLPKYLNTTDIGASKYAIEYCRFLMKYHYGSIECLKMEFKLSRVVFLIDTRYYQIVRMAVCMMQIGISASCSYDSIHEPVNSHLSFSLDTWTLLNITSYPNSKMQKCLIWTLEFEQSGLKTI